MMPDALRVCARLPSAVPLPPHRSRLAHQHSVLNSVHSVAHSSNPSITNVPELPTGYPSPRMPATMGPFGAAASSGGGAAAAMATADGGTYGTPGNSLIGRPVPANAFREFVTDSSLSPRGSLYRALSPANSGSTAIAPGASMSAGGAGPGDGSLGLTHGSVAGTSARGLATPDRAAAGSDGAAAGSDGAAAAAGGAAGQNAGSVRTATAGGGNGINNTSLAKSLERFLLEQRVQRSASSEPRIHRVSRLGLHTPRTGGGAGSGGPGVQSAASGSGGGSGSAGAGNGAPTTPTSPFVDGHACLPPWLEGTLGRDSAGIGSPRVTGGPGHGSPRNSAAHGIYTSGGSVSVQIPWFQSAAACPSPAASLHSSITGLNSMGPGPGPLRAEGSASAVLPLRPGLELQPVGWDPATRGANRARRRRRASIGAMVNDMLTTGRRASFLTPGHALGGGGSGTPVTPPHSGRARERAVAAEVAPSAGSRTGRLHQVGAALARLLPGSPSGSAGGGGSGIGKTFAAAASGSAGAGGVSGSPAGGSSAALHVELPESPSSNPLHSPRSPLGVRRMASSPMGPALSHLGSSLPPSPHGDAVHRSQLPGSGDRSRRERPRSGAPGAQRPPSGPGARLRHEQRLHPHSHAHAHGHSHSHGHRPMQGHGHGPRHLPPPPPPSPPNSHTAPVSPPSVHWQNSGLPPDPPSPPLSSSEPYTPIAGTFTSAHAPPVSEPLPPVLSTHYSIEGAPQHMQQPSQPSQRTQPQPLVPHGDRPMSMPDARTVPPEVGSSSTARDNEDATLIGSPNAQSADANTILQDAATPAVGPNARDSTIPGGLVDAGGRHPVPSVNPALLGSGFSLGGLLTSMPEAALYRSEDELLGTEAGARVSTQGPFGSDAAVSSCGAVSGGLATGEGYSRAPTSQGQAQQGEPHQRRPAGHEQEQRQQEQEVRRLANGISGDRGQSHSDATGDADADTGAAAAGGEQSSHPSPSTPPPASEPSEPRSQLKMEAEALHGHGTNSSMGTESSPAVASLSTNASPRHTYPQRTTTAKSIGLPTDPGEAMPTFAANVQPGGASPREPLPRAGMPGLGSWGTHSSGRDTESSTAVSPAVLHARLAFAGPPSGDSSTPTATAPGEGSTRDVSGLLVTSNLDSLGVARMGSEQERAPEDRSRRGRYATAAGGAVPGAGGGHGPFQAAASAVAAAIYRPGAAAGATRSSSGGAPAPNGAALPRTGSVGPSSDGADGTAAANPVRAPSHDTHTPVPTRSRWVPSGVAATVTDSPPIHRRGLNRSGLADQTSAPAVGPMLARLPSSRRDGAGGGSRHTSGSLFSGSRNALISSQDAAAMAAIVSSAQVQGLLAGGAAAAAERGPYGPARGGAASPRWVDTDGSANSVVAELRSSAPAGSVLSVIATLAAQGSSSGAAGGSSRPGLRATQSMRRRASAGAMGLGPGAAVSLRAAADAAMSQLQLMNHVAGGPGHSPAGASPGLTAGGQVPTTPQRGLRKSTSSRGRSRGYISVSRHRRHSCCA